jgi:hypothetical protein
MITILLTFSLIITIFLFLINEKIKFIQARKVSEKISATVIGYNKEKGPFRHDYTKLNYPYVIVELQNIEARGIKLHYANNMNENLKIGQKIDVFWLGNKLAYWYAYDEGWVKFLPGSWNITKN